MGEAQEVTETPEAPDSSEVDFFDDMTEGGGDEVTVAPRSKEQVKKAEEPEEEEEELEEEGDEEEEEDEEESEEEEEESKTQTVKPKVKGKKIKIADAEGNELAINTGVEIPVKVDGKQEAVPLQELINNYSGAQAYDQKFSELSEERKGFENNLNILNDHMERVAEVASEIPKSENKTAKTYEFIHLISKLSGANAKEFTKLMSDVFIEEGRKLADMDERDYENWQLKREIELGKIDSEVSSKIKEGAERKSQTRQQDQEILTKYDIEADEFTKIKDFLNETYPDQKIGTQQVVYFQRLNLARSAVEEVAPEHAEDADLRDQLANFAVSNPEMTFDDLKQIVKETYGDANKEKEKEEEESTSRTLRRKLGKRATKKTAKKKARTATPSKRLQNASDIWDSDDF
jgi:hypothetical protein